MKSLGPWVSLLPCEIMVRRWPSVSQEEGPPLELISEFKISELWEIFIVSPPSLSILLEQFDRLGQRSLQLFDSNMLHIHTRNSSFFQPLLGLEDSEWVLLHGLIPWGGAACWDVLCLYLCLYLEAASLRFKKYQHVKSNLNSLWKTNAS